NGGNGQAEGDQAAQDVRPPAGKVATGDHDLPLPLPSSRRRTTRVGARDVRKSKGRATMATVEARPPGRSHRPTTLPPCTPECLPGWVVAHGTAAPSQESRWLARSG